METSHRDHPCNKRAAHSLESRPVGVLLAVTAIGYGIQLLAWPDPLRGSGVLVAMRELAPAWVWAIVFIVCGAAEIAAVIANRTGVRIAAASILLVPWAFLSGAAWWVQPHTLAPVGWTTYLLACLWILSRLTRRTA